MCFLLNSGAFSGSMLVFPDVCNLGDDKKFPFGASLHLPSFFLIGHVLEASCWRVDVFLL